MKKLLFILFAITLLSSCEKRPEQKAIELIDVWMTENKPSAVYSKAIDATSLDYTLEDQRVLDAKRVMLDSAMTYSTFAFNKDGLSPALESQGERIESMLDGLNDRMEEIAQERVWAIQEEIAQYEENHRATRKGENGYKVWVNYSLANEEKTLVFYFDKSVEKIIEVVER